MAKPGEGTDLTRKGKQVYRVLRGHSSGDALENTVQTEIEVRAARVKSFIQGEREE